MLARTKDLLVRLERYLFLFEEWVLVAGLTAMITLGTMQVVLRNFFNTGVEWADMFVRALVLWVGFLGASLATRKSKHIRIDILSKVITSPKASARREVMINILSLVMVVILLKASIDFTIAEAEYHMAAFLGIPTWVVFIIVPISLALITLRLMIEILIGRPLEADEYKEVEAR